MATEIYDFFELTTSFDLKPKGAIRHFQSKGLTTSFSWMDMISEEYITEVYGHGWKKKESSPLPPTGKGSSELPPEFSEISTLTQKRAANRADMQAIVDAAEYLGSHYKEIYGKRVEQLQQYMEETGVTETFKQKITEMMTDLPAEQAVESEKCFVFWAVDGSE